MAGSPATPLALSESNLSPVLKKATLLSPPTQWRPQFMSLELRRWRRGTWWDEEEEKGEEPGETKPKNKTN